MFPGSMVMFALGLYDVAAWCSSLVDYGPGDVLIIDQGSESTSCPGPSSCSSWVPWTLSNCTFGTASWR